MPTSPEAAPGFRWAPGFILAFVALLPFRGLAETVLSLGSLLAMGLLLRQRFQGGTSLLSREAWALTTALFFAYWLPELFSSVDAVDAGRALSESLLDLRYLPFLWLVAIAVANERGRRLTFVGLAVIAGAWTLDGLVQAVTGWSLGGAATADRLSGIFGADNLKLGLVLASLAPFPLQESARRFGLLGWTLAGLALGAVVLLAGARAAWATLALVLVISGWQQFGARRALVVLGLGGVLVLGLAIGFSDKLQERIERTGAALTGDSQGVDHALSGRLPIWKTAVNMAVAHPINGIGVRGFREAYRTYADPGDPWLVDREHGAGYHAHQIVLEVVSETGLLGLFLWLTGVALAIRAWATSPPTARERARAPALALLATVFPLNTHLAFYSTFWGGLTLLLAALYAGSLLAEADERRRLAD
jgi:O-antigen ligase